MYCRTYDDMSHAKVKLSQKKKKISFLAFQTFSVYENLSQICQFHTSFQDHKKKCCLEFISFNQFFGLILFNSRKTHSDFDKVAPILQKTLFLLFYGRTHLPWSPYERLSFTETKYYIYIFFYI